MFVKDAAHKTEKNRDATQAIYKSPCMVSSTRSPPMLEVKHHFEYFIELQNDSCLSLDGIGDAFDMLFKNSTDTLVTSVCRMQLQLRGLRTTSCGCDTTSIAQDRFTLARCEIIDDNCIEIKLIRDYYPNGREWCSQEWHDVLAVNNDGKIILIEPYHLTRFKRDLVPTNSQDRMDSSSTSSSPIPIEV